MLPGFGDNVRIRQNPATEAAGIANLEGNVYGETTPSSTNVDIVGELEADYAINVHIDELNEGFWLDPNAVEFVDHAPGSEIRIDGASTKSVRQPDGSWIEVPVERESKGLLARLRTWLRG